MGNNIWEFMRCDKHVCEVHLYHLWEDFITVYVRIRINKEYSRIKDLIRNGQNPTP